jgi:riboflavin synthase
MFTGIVQGIAIISEITGSDSLKTLLISFPDNALHNVTKGASIAINGTCLTVTSFETDKNIASFDVMLETLKLTNLASLKPGSKVNYERAASIGDEIGGHLMSGHIHASVEILDVESSHETYSISFKTPPKLGKYLLDKGFVGLNGCSLTIGEATSDSFNVHLIPETLDVTTFGDLRPGDKVNLEIDPQTQTIVETVERIMETKKPA